MATKLGVTIYYTSFVDGQGVGASNYTAYAPHLDTDFIAIQSAVNALIDEVQAVNGPASLIAFDLSTIDDPNGPVGVKQLGVFGGHSYEITNISGINLTVQRGRAIVLSTSRVDNQNVVVLEDTDGGDGTRFIAIDSNGIPSLETAFGQQDLDIASIDFTTGAFVSASLLQLAHNFPDGDGHLDLLERPTLSAFTAAGAGVQRSGQKVFRTVAPRLGAIERLIVGYASEADGDTLPQLGLRPGSAGTPSVTLTDGAGASDDVGFYRVSSSIMGFAQGSSNRLQLGSFGMRAADGSAPTPAFAGISRTSTGIYFAAGPLLGLAVNGAAAATLTTALLDVLTTQVQFLAGVVGAPTLYFAGDTTSGIYRPAANQIGISISSVQQGFWSSGGLRMKDGSAALPSINGSGFTTTGVFWDSGGFGIAVGAALVAKFTTEGHLDLPLQPRVRVANTNSARADSATLTDVTFSAANEQYDVGGWHADGAAEFIVPTGADGTFHAIVTAVFDQDNDGVRRVVLMFDGVIVAEDIRADVDTAAPVHINLAAELDLVATDVIKIQASTTHGGGGTLDADFTLSIRKVA